MFISFYFLFFAYKNYNARIDIPAADVPIAEVFLSYTFLAVLAFLISNAIIAAANIKLIVHTYFCFFIYQNQYAKVVISAVRTFLFNIFLAFFLFLIVNIKAVAISILSLLHIAIFVFSFI